MRRWQVVAGGVIMAVMAVVTGPAASRPPPAVDHEVPHAPELSGVMDRIHRPVHSTMYSPRPACPRTGISTGEHLQQGEQQWFV